MVGEGVAAALAAPSDGRGGAVSVWALTGASDSTKPERAIKAAPAAGRARRLNREPSDASKSFIGAFSTRAWKRQSTMQPSEMQAFERSPTAYVVP